MRHVVIYVTDILLACITYIKNKRMRGKYYVKSI